MAAFQMINGVLRVGTSGDYKPYSHFDPGSNVYDGIDIELAHLLGTHLGVEVEFVRFRWPQLVADLLADKFDIAMSGITRDLERARTVAFTDAYMTFGSCPLVRRSDALRYQSTDAIDQPGVRVIFNEGGSNDRNLTRLLQRATVLRHGRNEKIAHFVDEGGADVWITDNIEALYWSRELPSLVAVNPTQTLTVGTKGFLIRQGDQTFLNWLNLWLEQMRLQGEVAALERRWLGIESAASLA